MKRLIVLIAIALSSLSVSAEVAWTQSDGTPLVTNFVSWVAPDTYVGGEPLDPADISGYEISWACTANCTVAGSPVPVEDYTEASTLGGIGITQQDLTALPAMPDGTIKIAVKVIHANGNKSVYSTPDLILGKTTILPTIPGAPTGVTAQ